MTGSGAFCLGVSIPVDSVSGSRPAIRFDSAAPDSRKGLPDSICLTDDGRVIARRDRMGLGTIHFARSAAGELLLSDSLSWIAGKLGMVTLDPSSVCEHLTYRYVSGTRTLFREISMVPAGYRAVFMPERDGSWPCRLERDSRFAWGDQAARPLPEVSRGFGELLEGEAFRLSTDSGHLFFSGGLDSSLIASFFADTPEALTAGTAEEAYDECPRAEMAASAMNLRWSGARLAEADFLPILRRAVAASGGTLPVEQITSYQLLLEEFSPGGPVLAGYGADFLFGEGQRKYWAVLRLSRIVGMMAVQAGLGLYGWLGGRQRQQAGTAREFVRRLSDGDTWIDMMPSLDPPCHPDIARISLGLDTLPDYNEHRRRMLTDEMPPHLTQRVFITYSNLIADTIACWSRLLSAGGCSLRLPFLSTPLVDYVCGLDPRSYLRITERKPVIRTLAGKRLPPGILGLPKMSGALPVWRWIGSIEGGFHSVLGRLESRNFLDLRPSLSSLRASERYGYIPVWSSVNLELLLEHLEDAGVRIAGMR
jgi:asparagine synthetase B (glutamine-hydrolysing)